MGKESSEGNIKMLWRVVDRIRTRFLARGKLAPGEVTMRGETWDRKIIMGKQRARGLGYARGI